MNTATEIQEKEVISPDLGSMGDELDLCSSKLFCLSVIDFSAAARLDEAIEGFRSSMCDISCKIEEIAAQLHTIYFREKRGSQSIEK